MNNLSGKKAFGMMVIIVSIWGGCKADVDTSPLQMWKWVTITGIPSAYNGKYATVAFLHQTDGVLAESDGPRIPSNTVTVKMYDYNAYPYLNEFTGNGNYQVHFMITDYSGSTRYWYGFIYEMSITKETTYIPFDNFSKMILTVVFDSNGGSSIPSIPDVFYGDKIIKPTDPVKNGFIFAGWYKNAALIYEWDFNNDTVFEDMTLYAKWYNESEVE